MTKNRHWDVGQLKIMVVLIISFTKRYDDYDLGMRVPDNITLLLCDDNWGNIRKLPKPGMLERSGGYGNYYHFDYVGNSRNYKWLHTSLLQTCLERESVIDISSVIPGIYFLTVESNEEILKQKIVKN
jgi:hypothetical protein